MAQSYTALEHLNIINCEFLVCDDAKIHNSFKFMEVAGNVECIKEMSPDGNQLHCILPGNSRALLDDYNMQGYLVKEDACAQDKVDQSDHIIIYCTPEQYVQSTNICQEGNEQDAIRIIVDQSMIDGFLKNEELNGVKCASVLEDCFESEPTVQYMTYEKLSQQPNYQYAILKDGQLHVQALNLEDEQKSNLKENIVAFQTSLNFDSDRFNINNSKVSDLNKVTGKNLITGQTVTLDKYMNKLLSKVQDNYVNKRVVIGKTSNGKKLVGKILRVQKADTKGKSSIYFDQLQRRTKILSKQMKNMNKFPSSIINTVGNILTRLMDLDSIHQRLNSKNLIVKLCMSTYNTEEQIIIKNMFVIHGYMRNIKEKWYFLCTKLDDCKKYIDDHVFDYDDKIIETHNNDLPVKNILRNSRELKKLGQASRNKVVYLSLLITINKDGKITTKIHFSPRRSTPEHNEEIQIDTLFGCDECFKMYGNESLLLQHKTKHHVRWHFCSVCAKTFNSAGSLKRHFTIHNPSLRPLQCTVCLLRFTDQSSLTKHLVIHTGIRLFLCGICHRSFVNQGDLNVHSRIHNPVKQFLCEICGREFSRQSNLLRHVDIHRGDGALFQCHLCQCSYSYPSSLTRHIVHKHLSPVTRNAQI